MKKYYGLYCIVGQSLFLLLLILACKDHSIAQGRNHNWLIGYDVALFDTNVTSTKARLFYDSNSLTVIPETRKMPFRGTQGNISDENGNLIIVSNGCWIANATGDTMMNGGGLNTGNLTSLGWCDDVTGLPYFHTNVVLPFPGDSSKYIMIQQLRNEIFYNIIDMTMDGGLGAVTQKNVTFLQDTFSWGFSVCQHANGRDWWIVALKDYSNLLYNILVTPDTIATISSQLVSFPNINNNACQPTFSSDGTKFVYSTGLGGPAGWHDVRVLNFDRCSGIFDSLTYVYDSSGAGFGLAFSPNSNYLYHSKWNTIYQIDLSTFSQDTVAINDGFYSPYPPFQTDFWLMYLAADGKIYISSGNGVIDMHVINSPDSSGLACDVQQHSLHTPCFFVRSNVLHPNYYLGPVIGSLCDTLGLGMQELPHDFHFSVSPNPNNGNFKVSYLLPQNEKGKLEIFDITGRKVFDLALPEWSTMQVVSLPESISDGIYNCVISSNAARFTKKIALM